LPASLGGPYPHGQIAHVYSDVGLVTITVTQSWEGSWAIPALDAFGDFEPVERSATIPEFEVEQVQAVVE